MEDILTITYDNSDDDITALTVGKTRGEHTSILKVFYGNEAKTLYDILMNN